MFNLFQTVISAGGYRLSEIQHKIKKLYLLGDITESEMDRLLELAVGGVSADAERPELLVLIRNLAEDLDALAGRVKALEGAGEEPADYPAWKPWDGISGNYPCGAIVSHSGRLWISVFSGQNVWEPGVSGESFWTAYIP